MPIIRGDQLPESLQRQVLASYVHRWTHENARQTYRGQCPACEQALPRGFPLPNGQERDQWHAYHRPLQSDTEWLSEHAFRVTAAGRLDARIKSALPALFAD